ncbi:MarR family transcriptional regulator [Clostridia bacterium]|nr:MarR family transcriptional regulator [Clostridia bacterium]
MDNPNQNTDPALVDRIARNIFRALPLLRKRLLHMDTIQAEHGIPLSHVQVLSMLSETGSMSVSEISRRLGIAKPNITPLVDRLIEVGLVDRQRDTVDRRVVNVVIMPEGEEKLKAIHNTIVEQVHEWSENVSEQDFQDLSDALTTITRVLNANQG